MKRKKSFEQSELYNFKKSTFEGLATYQKHLEPQLAMYIYMLLANILITFPIKYNPVFSNGPKNLPKNPPDCPIL